MEKLELNFRHTVSSPRFQILLTKSKMATRLSPTCDASSDPRLLHMQEGPTPEEKQEHVKEK